ncbi:hypothetical protein B0H14DRAFT_3664810 [Mycena olivaceomarginata]|nr:hypothetical protein B0H14DRAFT_3664810 [Mycena olivaceomarginata]
MATEGPKAKLGRSESRSDKSLSHFRVSRCIARMGVLPEALHIPEEQEQLILPSVDLPVSSLMALELPPQRKSTVFVDHSDYLSDLPPTLTTFNVRDIPVPPAVVVKALSGAIISEPETKSKTARAFASTPWQQKGHRKVAVALSHFTAIL